MKAFPLIGATAMALLISSGAALAESHRGHERFAEMDTDQNGIVTENEVTARLRSDFSAADSDNNGTLSEDEARAFHETRREERRARRAEHRQERGSRRFERRAGEDGVIDFDEFAERGMRRYERADLDENGEVTETEMRLVAELMRERRGRHHRRSGGRHGGEDE